MLNRLVILLLTVLLISGASSGSLFAATEPCGLRIMELQTVGFDGDDTKDYLVIHNSGGNCPASSDNPIKISSYNGAGVRVEPIIEIKSSIAPGQSLVFVGSGLKDANPAADDLPFGLQAAYGAIVLDRSTATTTTVYDTLGWGSEESVFGTSPAAAMSAGQYLARRSGMVTGNNGVDFETIAYTCKGAEIVEVQPFVIDESGRTIDAWVEMVGTSAEKGDCLLEATGGDEYDVPSESLPNMGELAVVDGAYDQLGNAVPLHLGAVDGRVWLGNASRYGGNLLNLPVATSPPYSALVYGQSWAKFDDGWHATFRPTFGEANIFQMDADPAACGTVRLSELLPNPISGGKEWVELTNEGAETVSLGECLVKINDNKYYFSEQDSLAAGESQVFESLYNIDGDDKAVSLPDGGATVEFWRLHAGGAEERLQVVESYVGAAVKIDGEVVTAAPDGWSYARDLDGKWAWTEAATPNSDNSKEYDPIELGGLVEGPLQTVPADGSESGPQGVIGVRITELLPNPAAPQTDGEDEFVELFNSDPTDIDLSDFKLQAGNNYNYSMDLTGKVIPAGGYLVITSGESNLSLANSGGRARLVAADGQVLSETEGYAAAPEGQSWAYQDGKWQWTSGPTPGGTNVILPPLVGSLTAKKASTKKSTTSTSAKKTTKASTSTKAAKTKSSDASGSSESDEAAAVSSLHPVALAAVGAIAVIYAVYEYRQDIANKIYRFRRNRENRRNDRAKS